MECVYVLFVATSVSGYHSCACSRTYKYDAVRSLSSAQRGNRCGLPSFFWLQKPIQFDHDVLEDRRARTCCCRCASGSLLCNAMPCRRLDQVASVRSQLHSYSHNTGIYIWSSQYSRVLVKLGLEFGLGSGLYILTVYRDFKRLRMVGNDS